MGGGDKPLFNFLIQIISHMGSDFFLSFLKMYRAVSGIRGHKNQQI